MTRRTLSLLLLVSAWTGIGWAQRGPDHDAVVVPQNRIDARDLGYPPDEKLPGGGKLEPDWALQDPRDYLTILPRAVPKALREAGAKDGDVVGIGTHFTASSPMPVKQDGTPLCFLLAYKKQPHAWVKLWKHHAAQAEANRINEIGREWNEDFIRILQPTGNNSGSRRKTIRFANGTP